MKFPSKLTEEEDLLQKTYAKLRKTKKLLAALKAPKPEQTTTQAPEKRKLQEKPEHAMQEAKKLVKSGIIRIGSKDKDKQGFKRSKNFERKLQDPEKLSASLTFQPFTPSVEEEKVTSYRPSRPKGLYDNFVKSDPPKKGNTIYVSGHVITEDILRKAFSHFGNIVNITMEPERHCGFVSFENMDSADEAISQMDNSIVTGVQLHVTMARRQPNFDNITQDQSNKSWASIAANKSQKGSLDDKRDVVSYEEDDMF